MTIRTAKPGPNPRKLWDGEGLYLLIQSSGRKFWRLKYRYAGKEKKLSLGRYPEVSLKEARRHQDEAQEMLARGLYPEEQKRIRQASDASSAANTFSVIGEEYLTKAAHERREAWPPAFRSKFRQWASHLRDPALAGILNGDTDRPTVKRQIRAGRTDRVYSFILRSLGQVHLARAPGKRWLFPGAPFGNKSNQAGLD